MKKLSVVMLLCVGLLTLPAEKAGAQLFILEIIKKGITKVIKAVDLQVQRLQTRTIWLQNAQKVMENTMSDLHLKDITGWVKKQKDLYQDYYNGLAQVKGLITYYHRIREITQKQARLIQEYNKAWGLLKTDKHFTVNEINYIGQVYSGILDATVKNIDQLFIVVHSFASKMSDARRMEIINSVADRVDENYSDLHQFNTQNALLSLSRVRDENEAAMVKWMYGLQ